MLKVEIVIQQELDNEPELCGFNHLILLWIIVKADCPLGLCDSFKNIFNLSVI